MGGVIGARLAEAGNDVTLIDVSRPAIEAINGRGLLVQDQAGEVRQVRLPASDDPGSVGPVDLVVTFVKCYHTEQAVRSAAPLLGPATAVLSLQNGWGNAPRIAEIVGAPRVLVGVSYHSATLLEPGKVLHSGVGVTHVGELSGQLSERLLRLAQTFNAAGIETQASSEVLKVIWSKLALNACTLPTAALLRFYAHQLVEHQGTLDLMRALLREVVAVARAQGIELDEEERWNAITGLLRRAVGGKASMLQDVEKGRRTEIDVINGAIVEAGDRHGLDTPHNDAMVWLVRSLEATFAPAAAATLAQA